MEAAPAPVSLPTLLTTLIQLVNELLRKNTTMINYYIYPSPTPTEIAAYEPRLLILRTRLTNLSQLNLAVLPALIDDAICLVAKYIFPNISQLAASSIGIQTIFIEHYDPQLEERRPYDLIFVALKHYEQTVHHFVTTQMSSPRRQPAETFVAPPSATSPSLCRGATAFINNRDPGKISSVAQEHLLPQHRGRLADRGGVVLWWECPTCAFRLRYHASNSANIGINHTDEILIEDDVLDIAYRSAWLAKCHIYHPRQPPPPAPSLSPSPPPPSPMSPRPSDARSLPPQANTKVKAKPKDRPPPAPKRVSFTRRRSSGLFSSVTVQTTTTRIINRSPSPSHSAPSSPEPPRPRSKSKSKPKDEKGDKKAKKPPPPPPPDPPGPQGLRFFCPFCIANGKAMVGAHRHNADAAATDDDDKVPPEAVTCFENSKELMEHIEDRHILDRPVNLLLQKLKVAVHGEMAPGGPQEAARGQRWDLDLRGM